MEDGLLSLKWNNHKITFCEILRTLREKSHYTDATIAVEGKFYPVHKLVLSTCSEYFEDIFARTPCKSPVIVLKDVRSQDMDALLDYMYLGEVNVNQNDLASLLKTAECLRIKGLAVPDEDIGKSRKAPSDERQNSPPPKRRRHDSSRPVSPPVSGTNKTPTPSASPIQPPPLGSHSSPDRLDSDPPPQIVKVEMHEHDQEDGFRKDSYEGSVNEEGGGDFGGDVSKTDHDPEGYGASSFPGPSLQPGGDLAWEEGDSSSFPPESFSGDVTSGQQPQGNWGNVRASALIPVVEIRQPVAASTPTSQASSFVSNSAPKTAATPPIVPVPLAGAFAPFTACTPDLMTMTTFNGEKMAFVCPVCGKQFGQPYNLRRHLTTHTGERPYRCPHCNYAASQNVHLEKHIRRIHVNSSSHSSPTETAAAASGPAIAWTAEPTAVTP